MNRLLTILTLFALLLSCKSVTDKVKRDHEILGNFDNYQGIDLTNTIIVERHLIDLDNDGTLDTLLLENLSDLVGDPQLFTILKLKTQNQNIELRNIGGYKIDHDCKTELNQEIASDLLFVSEFNKKKKIILIWDYQYPDCSTMFEAFEFSNEGIKKIYSENAIIKDLSKSNQKLIMNISLNCDTQNDSAIIDLK